MTDTKMNTECRSCTNVSDIGKYHKKLKYLCNLVNNYDKYVEPNTHKKMYNGLLELSVKFRKMSKAQQHKIVLNYYVNFNRHRHLVELQSPTFSPIKKEDVFEEFQKCLNTVIKIHTNHVI